MRLKQNTSHGRLAGVRPIEPSLTVSPVCVRLVMTRLGVIPIPESESKDEFESGFDSGFGIMCIGIGFGVGIV